MASQKYFDTITPFPSDLPTIDFKEIPISGLMSGDPKAAKDLLEACKDLGFFLLELSGKEFGEQIVKEVDAVFDHCKENFNQSDEIKKAFPIVVGKNPLGCVISI